MVPHGIIIKPKCFSWNSGPLGSSLTSYHFQPHLPCSGLPGGVALLSAFLCLCALGHTIPSTCNPFPLSLVKKKIPAHGSTPSPDVTFCVRPPQCRPGRGTELCRPPQHVWPWPPRAVLAFVSTAPTPTRKYISHQNPIPTFTRTLGAKVSQTPFSLATCYAH